MAKVSIIIPARNERCLAQTVEDIFLKAAGDIEVIIILDGPTRHTVPNERPGLSIYQHSHPLGKSASMNHGANVARGKYLMFVDAHCMVCENFDGILQRDCDGDWVVIPRYFVLESKTFTLKNHRPVDYYYLAVTWSNPDPLIQCDHWMRRTLERRGQSFIDDTMSIPGSLTFMTADHFRKRLGGLAVPAAGTDSVGDWLDVVMKTWLGGGRVVVNKLAWYGHMNAPPTRGYTVNQEDSQRDYMAASRYWLENRWLERQHDFDWLIERFWPLPNVKTKMRDEKYMWPDDWRKDYEEIQWRKSL
jgi:glycosyltransferase involved in cell wall biosynthesis